MMLLLQNRAIGVAAFVVVLAAFFGSLSPAFLTVANANTILLNASILAIVACAQAIVVLTRNFDLSVGSTIALASYVGFDFVRLLPELGPLLVLAPVAVGGTCGIVNGLLVAYGNVPAVIATLGTMSIYRGIASLYAGGDQINLADLPTWVNGVVNGNVMGIPSLPLIAILVVTLAALMLRYLPVGRQIYAVGSNPEAAAYFGLDRRRVIFSAYVLAGLLTGLAAFLFGARSSWIVPYMAEGLELTTLAAVVIGGVSVLGGSGSVTGAAIGALAIGMIDNGLILIGASDFVRLFIQGAAIVVAVVVDVLIQGRIAELVGSMRRRAEA